MAPGWNSGGPVRRLNQPIPVWYTAGQVMQAGWFWPESREKGLPWMGAVSGVSGAAPKILASAGLHCEGLLHGESRARELGGPE